MKRIEDKMLDQLLNQLNPQTPKDKWNSFIARNIPHKTESGSCWCMPVWFVFIFGGTYDSGNGYGTRPNLFYTIRNEIRWWYGKRKEDKYWREHHKKYGYALDQMVKKSCDGGKTYTDAKPL